MTITDSGQEHIWGEDVMSITHSSQEHIGH